jgi:hypothetical protein
VKILDLVKDKYDREARLAPALMVLLPPVLLALVWFPGLRTPAAGLLTLLVAFGILVFLTQVGRDRGKRMEPELFDAAGGKPSIALLRHRDARLSGLQRQRYHDYLARAVGVPAPTAAEEAADPAKADEWYELAAGWLMARTRDTKKFGLLFQENVNYGFRRNLYALKRPAQVVGVIAILASLGYGGWRYHMAGEIPGAEVIAAVILVLAYLFFFTVWVTGEWVRIPSEGYARRLLEACEVVPLPAAKTAAAPAPSTRGRGKGSAK